MKKFFGSWWFLTGLVVVILILTLCVGLPFVVAGLQPWWVRLTIGGTIIVLWLLIAFWRRRRAKKRAEALERELAGPSAEDEESAAVNQRMIEALKALRKQSGKKRDYLYRQPWYVIIGPPGGGKTTAMINSGLRFPFSEQSFKGLGGTRNLDFWFADEAVLVDTAGRYTTQDSDSSVDAQGWKSLLRQLKRNRPLTPINGVIVALPVDELIGSDRAALDRHASLVRRRLSELREELEFAVPVYLIFTKADLIAGFMEFYDDLDVEGRRAVLGATFPADGRNPTSDDVVMAFDRFVSSQGARQARRLYEEVDQTRRSLLLGFPTQLGALRNRFARFIEGAFLSGDLPGGVLRGFYFSSGTQEGTPLDRILSGLADVYQGTTMPAAGEGSGKTYFLNRLLTEVIFREAGLAQADPAARRRQKMKLTIGLGAVATASVLVLIAWSVSMYKNLGFLSELNGSSVEARTLTQQTGLDLIQVRSTDPDLEQSLGVLRALRDLPQGYADQYENDEPGWTRRFGLYQRSRADEAVESYRDGLRRILLPRLMLRLEQYIAANASDPMAIYQPLKVYLMLGGQGPMDTNTVKTWIESDWTYEQFAGADRAPVRRELVEHLDALLEDEGMASAWPGRKAPLDGTTIATARNALSTLSLADRAYAVMKLKALSSGEPPWTADGAIASGDAQAFANGEEVLQLEIPYFFTRQGYELKYLTGLASVASDIEKDLWVLGEDADAAATQTQMNQIRPTVARLYSRDYIDAWDRVLNTPQPADYFNNAAARGAFTKSPSPLKSLLIELRDNTIFEGGSSALGEAGSELLQQSRFSRAIDVATDVAGERRFDAATEIEVYFRPTHDYVGDSENPGPIDDFVATIRRAGANFESAKLAGGGAGSEAAAAALQQAMGELVNATAGGVPQQLQGFVSGVASGGTQATVTAQTGVITDSYSGSVLPVCQTAVADRYPFVGTSQNDAMPMDLQRVFGLGGPFDQFMQQQAMPLLDMSGPIWRWKTDNQMAATLDPGRPEEFRKVLPLQTMLSGGLSFGFRANSFGPAVDEAVIEVGNNSFTFQKGAGSVERSITWSAQTPTPHAAVVLKNGGIEVDRITGSGPWALFRMMDQNTHKQNAGPQAQLFTFGRNTQTVVFRVTIPPNVDPFSRGGVWSFRCPVGL